MLTERTDARWLGLALLLVVGPLVGCGQQVQVEADHRDLILRLATGTSTEDSAIIDRAAADIERRSAAGELGEEPRRAFDRVIEAARDGDWDRARLLAYALRDGQKPSDADRERIASRPLPGMKKPGQGAPAP